MTSKTYFEQQLLLLKNQGLYRDLRLFDTSTPARTGSTTNFSSNDYLGLAKDSRLMSAAVAAIGRYGTGSTASRLMAGNTEIVEQLEQDLAGMTGMEAALVFGSGFLTNLGVLASVSEEGDEIFSDELNHASIIDGIRLSRARCSRFRHKDLDHLEAVLRKSTARGKRIIVSESVFSMDGDLAPVEGLADIARRHDSLLIIDEAHAVGVVGRNGGGVCRIAGREVQPDIVVGTLSKALGGYGGFVACSDAARRFLVNKARTFIYSTAPSPPCLGSAKEAVSIVSSHPEMGALLLEKAREFSRLLSTCGMNVLPFESQIIPVIVGSNDKAVAFSALLGQKGLVVRAVRPPTVPPGTSRIRFSVTLSLSNEQLERAAESTADAARELGLV